MAKKNDSQEAPVAVLYRVRPDQKKALRDEAFARAEDRGSGKPDASEVLREVLDDWMTKKKPSRK